MFVKMLPIRYRMDPFMSIKSFLKSVNHQLIQATSKQLYDLSNIVIELNNNKIPPVKTLFDVVFVFQNFEENRRNRSGGDFSIFQVDYATSKYPLALFASEDSDFFHFRLQYLSAYFTREDIDLLIIQFRLLVKRLSQNMDASIMEVAGGNDQTADFVEYDISFNFQ
jgi:mycobactin peptide synthetase MbtE